MDKFFDYKDITIRYRDSGKGNCIFLLHGFTESLEVWEYFVNNLSVKYRVVTVDLPGHGMSGIHGEVHTMDFMAEAVNALAVSLNIKKLLLTGHSMGGYVSLEFAGKYPDKLSGLALFHSHASPDSEQDKINRNRVIKLINNDKFDFLTHFIPGLFAPENQDKFKNEIENLQLLSNKYMTNKGLTAALEGMKIRSDHTETLSKLRIPVLYIIGKKDSRINTEELLAQAMMPDDCRIQLINCGHMGYIEAKEETLSFIKSFAEYVFKN